MTYFRILNRYICDDCEDTGITAEYEKNNKLYQEICKCIYGKSYFPNAYIDIEDDEDVVVVYRSNIHDQTC